jgi:D-glucosaminate-6-phosphate ammonia-lyase
MVDPFVRYGLRRVINASGTETPYGGSPVRDEVIEAVRALVPHSVFMAELQAAACRTIASALGCEAGCVTGCTAASIAMAVAGCMTGADRGRIDQLPDTTGMRNEIVIQKGHVVDYGHDVTQNVRVAGARVVEIGVATDCQPYQLQHALSERTAAALYVVSHLTVQHRMIGLEDFCAICHGVGVPVIVDAASVPDPRPLLAAGADLVLVSAQKSFSGLTAGIVAGRRSLVETCLLQQHGIGRPMKVGKEGVVGAIAAIEAWRADDRAATQAQVTRRVEAAMARLGALAGVRASAHGRTQVRLDIDAAAAGQSAAALSNVLRAQDPAILLWDLHSQSGKLLLTLGKVSDATAELICARIEETLARTPAATR